MTHIDTRTATEKARDAKHAQICNQYLELANTMPGTAAHRLMGVIAQQNGMTIPGVRNVLIKAGLYATK